MNYRELTRKLRRLGCEFDRRAGGDHEIWVNQATHARTTIPNWGSDDLRAGTVSRILRDLGVRKRDLDRA